VKVFAELGLSGIMRHMTNPTKLTRKRYVFATLALLTLLALLLAGCRQLAPRIKWNGTQIEWQSYEAGLVRAKAEHKPICLVFYADWCPGCKEYDRMFEDPRVIERAGDLVMIHVNGDERADLDRKFEAGGRFFPRTYFLTQDGVLLKGVQAPDGSYAYDKYDPAGLLAGMGAARKIVMNHPQLSPGEDPSALTTAQFCAPAANDPTCAACLKAQCCEAGFACRNDRSCSCRLSCQIGGCSASVAATCPRGNTAYRSMTACMSARCADVCPNIQGTRP